jgi:hypothetical protein
MIIHVDPSVAPAAITLSEPSDFQGFKVVVPADADPQALTAALATLGRAEGTDHVFVAPDAVSALAGETAADPAWAEGFAGMVGYATSKGWTDADGRIRAHVERQDAPAA